MNFACVLYSFNRPDYLRQTIASLERNLPADWFFFQDGAVREDGKKMSKEENIQQSLTILRDSPLDGELLYHGENVGITWQFKKAFELFEGYDYLLIFEDDMIVSKDYISLVLNMAQALPESILCCGHHNWWEKFPEAKLGDVVEGRCQLWGYWFPKSLFEVVRKDFESYVEMVGKLHTARPHKEIMERFNVPTSAVDNFIGRRLWKWGYGRYATVWPRGKYIGKQGLHMNPGKWEQKFSGLSQWEYPGDRDRREFNVVFRGKR